MIGCAVPRDRLAGLRAAERYCAVWSGGAAISGASLAASAEYLPALDQDAGALEGHPGAGNLLISPYIRARASAHGAALRLSRAGARVTDLAR